PGAPGSRRGWGSAARRPPRSRAALSASTRRGRLAALVRRMQPSDYLQPLVAPLRFLAQSDFLRVGTVKGLGPLVQAALVGARREGAVTDVRLLERAAGALEAADVESTRSALRALAQRLSGPGAPGQGDGRSGAPPGAGRPEPPRRASHPRDTPPPHRGRPPRPVLLSSPCQGGAATAPVPWAGSARRGTRRRRGGGGPAALH